MQREGIPVRFVRSVFVPEDETCFYLYEAASVDAVREAARRAALPVEAVAVSVDASKVDANDDLVDEFPILYTNAKTGTASLSPDETGQDLRPLFDAIVQHVPPPRGNPPWIPARLARSFPVSRLRGSHGTRPPFHLPALIPGCSRGGLLVESSRNPHPGPPHAPWRSPTRARFLARNISPTIAPLPAKRLQFCARSAREWGARPKRKNPETPNC